MALIRVLAGFMDTSFVFKGFIFYSLENIVLIFTVHVNFDLKLIPCESTRSFFIKISTY